VGVEGGEVVSLAVVVVAGCVVGWLVVTAVLAWELTGAWIRERRRSGR
jgi:hypothetical protein